MTSFAGHFYFSPRGRTGRKLYWLFGIVPLFLGGLLVGFFAAFLHLSHDDLLMLMGVLTPLGAWVWVCLGARRLQDIGVSGWWMILVFVLPLAVSYALPARLLQLPALLTMICLGSLPGVVGDNKFGRDPRAQYQK